jgi:3-deoxy-manno-octulosonate cytidylyltransferase (CMP-KDO synthetase)
VTPIVLIPARMASSRLPGKPLAMIAGRPMIAHVLDRAREAGVGPVAVACAEEEIAAAVRAAGGEAVMTDPALPSGSDRCFAAAEALDPEGRYDVVVNLQGDLPTLDPAAIRAVLAPLADPGVDIATLVTAIHDASEATAPNFVKAAVVFPEGVTTARALYFSRLPVPYGPGPLWHHIGIYAWRRAALARFVALPPSGLEQREKLEQLRAMEAGMTIACTPIASAPFGVDTPEDLARAKAIMENLGPSSKDTPRD